MIFTSLSVIMSVIVSNIHQNFKNCNSIEQSLPKLMRKIFIGFLARIFNMQKDANDLLQTTVSKNKYNTKYYNILKPAEQLLSTIHLYLTKTPHALKEFLTKMGLNALLC